MTGAPKISAIDHIAALEPVGRGASMGALGASSPNGDLDLALTIRTFAVADGRIHLWVGGGIVWDSEPGRGDRGVVGQGAAAARGDRPRAGQRGRDPRVSSRSPSPGAASSTAGEPVVHADDEAFLRGRGAFETLRVYGGRPFRLDEHLARLEASAARLGFEPLAAPRSRGWRAGARRGRRARRRCSAST